MTDRLVYVHADLDGATHLVGRLYAHHNKGKETASFEYEEAWLKNPQRFSLEPALNVGPGQYYTPRSLFGAIGDPKYDNNPSAKVRPEQGLLRMRKSLGLYARGASPPCCFACISRFLRFPGVHRRTKEDSE